MATNKSTSKQVDGVGAAPEQPKQVYDQPGGYQQQYSQPYRSPHKGKAKWLTLEYGLAMGSLVLASLLVVAVINALFGGWAGLGSAVGYSGSVWALGLFSLVAVTPAAGLVYTAVAAVLLGVVALMLFKRVSRTIPEREGYTGRISYKVITYGAFAVLAASSLALIAKMVGVLINSLLFIGVSKAGEVYKALYLAEFLPYLLGLGLLVVVGMFIGKIITGKNKSKIASIIVLSVASAALVASAITVAVQVRDTGSDRYYNYSGSRIAPSISDITSPIIPNVDSLLF